MTHSLFRRPLFYLVSLLVTSCAALPEVKEKIGFSDIEGIWESTGFIHYIKLDLRSGDKSTITLINDDLKVEKVKLSNLSFMKSSISFEFVRDSDQNVKIKFKGILLGDRLMFTEQASKDDVLSFIRQDRLTKMRLESIAK